MASPRPQPAPTAPAPKHPHPSPARVGRRVLGSNSKPLRPSSGVYSSGRPSPSPAPSEVSEHELGKGLPRDHEVPEHLLRCDMAAANGLPGSKIRHGEVILCPICSEEMTSLLQLNRHLDDMHAEVEPLSKDDLTTWFRKRMLKAKTFQPVAVLNQKLKGLDVFEANDSSVSLPTNISTNPAPQEPKDADLYVTRTHWQKSYGDSYCLDPTCQRPLGVVNGCINCRSCGKLFCEEHTMYQIKLSRSAQHEPVRGFWSRVCETCFKSRIGYNDHHGVIIDHTAAFAAVRRKTVDRAYLEVSRLEKRLTKLTQLLTSSTVSDQGSGFIKGLTKPLQNPRRALEQSVVAWEDDAAVTNCPYCAQTFSRFSQPRHHCRLCGKIVCGDPRTGCSRDLSLDVAIAAPSSSSSEKPANTTLAIRLCTSCTKTLFSRRDFAQSLLAPPPAYARAYSTLIIFQSGIAEQLPRFQRLVEGVQKRPQDAVEGVRMKRRIVDALTRVDGVMRQIAPPANSADQGTEHRLRKNITLATATWGREVGMRVKTAAAILNASTASSTASTTIPRPSTTTIPMSVSPSPSPSLKLSPSTPLPSQAAAADEDREVVLVLEEQKFLLLHALEGAKRRRQFDEVEALARSVEEIDDEVARRGGGVLGV